MTIIGQCTENWIWVGWNARTDRRTDGVTDWRTDERWDWRTLGLRDGRCYWWRDWRTNWQYHETKTPVTDARTAPTVDAYPNQREEEEKKKRKEKGSWSSAHRQRWSENEEEAEDETEDIWRRKRRRMRKTCRGDEGMRIRCLKKGKLSEYINVRNVRTCFYLAFKDKWITIDQLIGWLWLYGVRGINFF